MFLRSLAIKIVMMGVKQDDSGQRSKPAGLID